MGISRAGVTELLRELKQDREAFERLVRIVYDDIRQLARSQQRGFRDSLTLQTTAVVHEAFAKLFQGDPRITDRKHLMCLMSRVIRQIIVDHARRQMRQKRGSDAVRADINVEDLSADNRDAASILDLEAALQRLDEVDSDLVDLVCAHYFAGHSADDIARMNGVSRRTVSRRLKRASTWLRFELEH